ncbi:MAG: PepSY-associated TM helix domain-containing protein [Bacteroidota bacterium]
MTVKKIIGKIHLWLGLSSGLIIVFLGITGCILAFQREIESLQSFRHVEAQNKPFLPPSELKKVAINALAKYPPHNVNYGAKDEAATIMYYGDDYFYTLFLNPYTGEVLKLKDMSKDFFRVIINGHFYLWLPPKIGQTIATSATLIFLIMIISGLILWWPRNKAAKKQRFTIKWNASWKRKNYDLHNVLGFYMTWIALLIALTGLVMGFQWFANSVYWVTSGGKKKIEYYEPLSGKNKQSLVAISAEDKVWEITKANYPKAETIEVHYVENDSVAIGAGANPDKTTYWKADYRYYDQYTFEEIPVTHMYGRLSNTTMADKITRMNYDIHVGAVLGLPGKILAFCGSLIAASLPITGFLLWRGRRRAKKKSVEALA